MKEDGVVTVGVEAAEDGGARWTLDAKALGADGDGGVGSEAGV
jgi:hypothetical protein